MVFTGNQAPYHITQPSTDYDVQIVSSTATMANLTCSLNITIPNDIEPFWVTSLKKPSESKRTDNGVILLIKNLQLLDDGIYQCVFKDVSGSGWTLKRNIRLSITSTCILYITTIGESSDLLLV